MKKSFLLICFFMMALSGFSQLSEKVGIGVRLQTDSTRGYTIPKVIGLVPNSPALAAGLQEGDFILKVNEKSTRDIKLSDVVSWIVGEEGTEVRLAVERGGSAKNFSLVRQKYKYAESYYLPALKDDEFCSSLARLMNDAGYDFVNTKDSTRFVDEQGAFGRRNYESKIKVPGVEKVAIASSFGYSCDILIGTFNTEDEVNESGEKIFARITACFPEYYSESISREDESNVIQIGKTFSDGYESPILEMFSYRDATDHSFKLTLRINGGKPTRYYKIENKGLDNPYAKSLKVIYDDILNNYENVKGTKHESGGEGIFSMKSYWYEVNPMPVGAHDCFIAEGGLSMSNGCKCRFYLGENREEAVAAFQKVFEVTREALGADFTYILEAPELDMTIPDGAESVVVFGIKKERGYESLPLLGLVLEKDAQNKYGVNMYFHKFGF